MSSLTSAATEEIVFSCSTSSSPAAEGPVLVLSSLQNSSTPSSSSRGPRDLGDVADERRDFGGRSSSLSGWSGSVFGGVFLWLPFELSHSRRSYAIFEAMFLKPMLVPEMRLNRTPFRDRRGSLHTSISHCTRESVLGSPWTQSRTKLKTDIISN